MKRSRMISVKIYFIIHCLCCHILMIFARNNSNINLSDFMEHREKRSLIFEGGGTIKLVIGPSLAVQLADPVVWRSLVCSYNLHGGHYMIPDKPLYPWDKWEDTFARSMKKMRADFDLLGKYCEDESRLFVYTALETLMNQQNRNGRACLLRSICENAQVDQHVGVFSEILDIVLTPGKEKLDKVYVEAYEAGKSGSDCLLLYKECPMGSSVLDQYLDEL